jgi:hypothetical protein
LTWVYVLLYIQLYGTAKPQSREIKNLITKCPKIFSTVRLKALLWSGEIFGLFNLKGGDVRKSVALTPSERADWLFFKSEHKTIGDIFYRLKTA